MVGALRDCEAVIHSILGQPVNSITALAFVAGGVFIVARSDLTWVGIASAATGLGSFLFHGPMPAYSGWVHDATLVWLLLVVMSEGRRWQRWAQLPGLGAVGVAMLIPGTFSPVAVAIAAAAIALVVFEDRSMATLGPLALVAAVAIVGRLGATGGPLCNPESVWQPHGLWHLGAAAAVAWWAVGRSNVGGTKHATASPHA